MKKVFLTIFMTLLIFSVCSTAKAGELKDLLNQKKPLALLLYANWADNAENAQKNFAELEDAYAKTYNFKKINIATEEAKEFNQMSYIYTNLPYVMLYKSQGKISRWVNRDCLLDASCIQGKLDIFAE